MASALRRLKLWFSISSLPVFSLLVFLQLQTSNTPSWQTPNPNDAPRTTTEVEEFSLLENECKLPIIQPNESDLILYVEHTRMLYCDRTMPNLASLDEDGYLVIHREIESGRRSHLPPFECYYQPISGGLYPKHTHYTLSANRTLLEANRFMKVPDEQFLIECYNVTIIASIDDVVKRNGSIIYRRAFAGFPDKFPKTQDTQQQNAEKLLDFDYANPEKPSLSMLVLESASRNQFLRHMRRTVDYMKKLGFIFFEGYTKMGDNSNVNLLPVLSGKSVLPQIGGDGYEVVPNGTVLDLAETEFLWTMMKERRCITMFNDDIGHSHRGLFHYGSASLKGFEKPPTNFYFRPYHLHETKHKTSKYCTPTGQKKAQTYVEMWENFSIKFKNYCHFGFTFITNLSHDNPNHLEAIDQQLRISLERLVASEVFNNTVVVIMGDHGQRLYNIQTTYAGRIEERTPLFSIRLPDYFAKKNAEKVKTLKKNSKRLISNYDVHQTLKDIARGAFRSERSYSERKGRGKSLFEEEIETSRNCEDAGIPPNFCLCMNLQKTTRMNRNSEEYKNIKKLVELKLRNYDCIQKESILLEEDPLNVYAINQMVRHGLRNEMDWPKVANTVAALEILFIDVTVSANVRRTSLRKFKQQPRVRLLFRIKHYPAKKTFEMAIEPMILNKSKTLSCRTKRLKNFCSECCDGLSLV